MNDELKVGSDVMVPRTGGGETPGKIVCISGEKARVEFVAGKTYQGNPTPEIDQNRTAAKTVDLADLKLIKKVEGGF